MTDHGQRVGYVRVSTLDQNTDRQLDGEHLHRTFTDKLSGKNTNRPELDALRAFVRDGDLIVVHSLDRLARNLDDLRRLVREFTDRGVRVTFLKEGLTFTGDDSPMSKLLLSVMGAFAEFERALIRERQAEGIAAAKARGVYRGRAPALTSSQADELQVRAHNGEPITALAREFGVSRQTAYVYLRRSSGALPGR
ncbi:recombinase family protein [Nocardioides sp. R1-1]|uniref:recombinase family protein n=1 Tax=Nocardioides sp. R1-1 TaxID=3383502 RepID=UPI0038CFC830